MTSGQATKVRLVRCPKCLRVLPELADLPLYKCGGCGAVLQAKYRRDGIRNAGLGLPETDLAHSRDLEHVAEVKDSCSASQQANPFHAEECPLDQNNWINQNESGDCGKDQLEDMNSPNEVSSSAELTRHEIVESSLVTGEDSVDENKESSSELKSSSTDNQGAIEGRNSMISAYKPAGESIASSMLVSLSHEQLEQSHKSHGIDHVTSTDSLDTTELIDPSSSAFRDESKSPTTSAHAYDGSISSCDGPDDPVSDPLLHLDRRIFKVVGAEESTEWDNYLVNNMTTGNLGMQHQARKSSISGKKHYSMKYNARDSDEPLEPTRHVHQIRNRMRPEDNEYPSVPLYHRSSVAGYENASPSSHWHDEFQCNSNFCSPEKPEYPEAEKIKLLRMVYELQDQLDRTNTPRGMATQEVPTGVGWKEKQIPTYYNHESTGKEIYHDLNYPRHPTRYWQGKKGSLQGRFSQMPFSGEATNSRLQVDRACLHCGPRDWQLPLQLPPSAPCCNKGHCKIHMGYKCHSACNSCFSSPQGHGESEFPLRGHDTKYDAQRHKGRYMDSHFPLWSHDTKSDDQRYKDDLLREKSHLVKRHFRPIAGGAPFVTCYCCLRPLQLPADFLLFKRRCHRLRCGACSEVLKFSLQRSTHILPYKPGVLDLPSSDIGGDSYAINMRNLMSASQSNDWPPADSVSCSDDYGLSYCKSCSTEGETVSLTPPFSAFRGNTDHRKLSSGSSLEPVAEKNKFFPKQPSNVGTMNKFSEIEELPLKQPSNVCIMNKFSEIEELPLTTGSPLHRLMGYSSPSEVLKSLPQ